MIDLNKLKVDALSPEAKEKLNTFLEPKNMATKRYEEYKYATPAERERIAQENETTPDKYETKLRMLVSLRDQPEDGSIAESE